MRTMKKSLKYLQLSVATEERLIYEATRLNNYPPLPNITVSFDAKLASQRYM